MLIIPLVEVDAVNVGYGCLDSIIDKTTVTDDQGIHACAINELYLNEKTSACDSNRHRRL